jgi:hypothetical protein
MTTWAEYKNYMRRAILNDDPTDIAKRRYSDEQMWIALGWALDGFCSHTAKQAEYIDATFTGTTVSIPTDVYDDFGNTARVTVGEDVYRSSYHSMGHSPSSDGDFYKPWGGVVTLRNEITSETTLSIQYFSQWSKPATVDDDTFVLDFPLWAEAAVGYLIASHLMTGFSMRVPQLRQFAENPEKGGPEDNPFRRQQQWLLRMYQGEVDRVNKQDRANFFVET